MCGPWTVQWAERDVANHSEQGYKLISVISDCMSLKKGFLQHCYHILGYSAKTDIFLVFLSVVCFTKACSEVCD